MKMTALKNLIYNISLFWVCKLELCININLWNTTYFVLTDFGKCIINMKLVSFIW